MRILFCLLLVLVCSGCVLRSTAGTSFDGLGTQYEARPLAERTAQEIRHRYSPARTTIALDRTEGPFGDSLEQALRTQGFAVGSSGTAISYTVDVYEDGTPPIGYVQLRLPEGQFLSFSRELEAPIWSTVNPTPVVESPTLAENDFPPASTVPVVDYVPTSSANQVSVERTVTEPVVSPASLPAHTVRRTATAAQVARRNNIAVDEFCLWNGVSATDPLPTSYRVHLRKPVVPVVAAVPVSPAPAAVPAKTEATVPVANSLPSETTSSTKPVMPASAKPVMPASAQVEAVEPVDTPTLLATPVVAADIETLIAPLEAWEIKPGGLRVQISAWAAQAGYQVVWKADTDFLMESQASFQGDFLSAVKSLFWGLQRTGDHSLRVTVYQGNKVLEITEG